MMDVESEEIRSMSSPDRTAPPSIRDASWIARRNAVGIREAGAIAADWQLSHEDLATLLGMTKDTLQHHLKVAETLSGELDLSDDHIERLSLLLGIQQGLRMLFQTRSNRRLWLLNGNTGAVFNGQAPLARMLAGRLEDLYCVRKVLKSALG